MFLDTTLNAVELRVSDRCNVHQQNETDVIVPIQRSNRLSDRVRFLYSVAHSGATLRKASRHVTSRLVTSRQPITLFFFTAALSINLNAFRLSLLHEVLVMASLRRN